MTQPPPVPRPRASGTRSSRSGARSSRSGTRSGRRSGSSRRGSKTGPRGGAIAQDSNDRQMGMLCHLLGFANYVFPLGGIIAPLVIWNIKKDESRYIDEQGRESVNFQLTMAILALAMIPLCFVIIGFFGLAAVGVYGFVMTIVGTVRASDGKDFRHPIILRLI